MIEGDAIVRVDMKRRCARLSCGRWGRVAAFTSALSRC